MDSRKKRICIGAVLPLIVTALICGFIFSKNLSFSNELFSKESEEVKQDENIIQITKNNWEEYFTIEQELILHKNEAGELESVQYVDRVILKEEYRDQFETKEGEGITFNGRQKVVKKVYEITDAKAGEWEIKGNLKYIKRNGENDYTLRWWSSKDAVEGVYTYEHETFEYLGQSSVEVPEEFEVEAAAGTLYRK